MTSPVRERFLPSATHTLAWLVTLRFPLVVYAASRLVDGILLWWLTRDQVAMPDPRYPGYHSGAPTPSSPDYWTATTLWDGQWYRTIVEEGYPSALPMEGDGSVSRSAWAFYPAYPMLVRAVMWVSRAPFEVVAPTLSTVLGAGAVCLLYRLVANAGGVNSARAAVVGVCTYAAAPVFQVAYPESLALLLVLLCLWLAQRGAWAWFAAAATLLSVTRPLVAALGGALVLAALLPWPGGDRPDPAHRRRLLAAGVGSGALAFVWPAVAAAVTGRWDAYVATARAWTAGLGGPFPGLTVWGGSLGWAGVLLLIALISWLLLLAWRPRAAGWGTPLRAWMVAYPLYLFATTVPGPSHIRYLALVGVVPFAATERPGRSVRRWAGLVVVAVAGTLAQVLWIRYFWRLVGTTP